MRSHARVDKPAYSGHGPLMREETARSGADLKPWAWSMVLCGLLVVCYWPAMHGQVLWDDQAHLTAPDLRSWAGLGRIWFELGATQQYYPVLHSAFWLEHRLWGDATMLSR